jgi:hypothetical protein
VGLNPSKIFGMADAAVGEEANNTGMGRPITIGRNSGRDGKMNC